MYTRGMGAVDPSGTSWCGSGNPFVDFFCPASAIAPTVEQIITDTSDYGSQLSPASRAAAETMARNVIAKDDSCNYSEINAMGWTDKLACNLKGTGSGNTVLWVGLGIVAVLLLRR